ncbi:MAG: sterol desaturase family protein, partial [Sandaracinaceae bacterium]
MGHWLGSLDLLSAIGVLSAFFVGLTLIALAAGYAAERSMQRQGRTVFDVPLKRGQTRTELIGTVLFHLLFIPCAALALTSGWVRFEEGWVREIATFGLSMIGFQAYYWFLHRAMHWRPLFFIHKWHHESLVTTPLTGFSMSPFEAAGWIVGFLGPAVLFTLAGGVGFWGYAAFLSIAWYG